MQARTRIASIQTRAALLLFLCAVLLSACGGGSTSRPDAFRDARANAVSMHAIGLVGTPYRYGGNTPAGGFDCSGLVGYVYRESAGLALPRSTADLARMDARDVDADALRVGDLVLFGSRRKVDHIGIYVGERRFVHAPSTGGTVRLDSLDADYWKRRVRGGRRVI